MNQNVLHHLSLIAESHGVYAEDLPDQLMSKYTSVGLMGLAILLVLKQYIFKPIQCLVPAEWPRPWQEYAENYCWIQNTYRVAFMEPGHPGLQSRRESEISYFQWVPILLAIQAFMVFAPHAFWRVASAQSGCDPHRIVKLAMELEGANSKNKRHKLTQFASSQLSRAIWLATALHKQTANADNQQFCPQLSRNCGCFLFVSYLISKVAYLLCGLGHLYLMKTYLGFDELQFGWSCAADLLNGRQWQQTRIFPRVTFCDIPIKHLGQWNTRSVQCVLPMNMLNEKIYIFLWFWIVFCMVLTMAYAIYWMASVALRAQRLSFLNRLHRITHPRSGFGNKPADTPLATDGEEQMRNLRLDGVFILQMVAAKCGDQCAAQILEATRERRNQQNSSTDEASQDSVDLSTVANLVDANVLTGGSDSDFGSKEYSSNGHVFGPSSDV